MVGSPALLPHQGTSPSMSSNASLAPANQLKSKKSLDWLPKSFKRSKSSSSSASTAPSTSSRKSFRGSRQDLATGNNAQTRSTESSNSDTPLTTIPASPRDTHSFSSSNDERSAGERSNSPSQPSPRLPVTPEDLPFQTLRVSPLPSPLGMSEVAEQPKDYLSAPVAAQTSPRPRTSGSDKASSRPDARSLGDKQSNEYEKLVLSLSSRKALRTMLDDPVGLWKFGQFLASEMNAETLVFWLNAEQHRNDLKRLYSLTQRIHSLHIPPSAPLALNITSQERQAIETSIKWFMRAEDPFKAARTAAFNALYHDAWPRFLQWRLELLHAHLRSGGKTPPATSFTLADPSPERD
ncbi:hypothetical protein P389DRAFT_86738 [Cystobasidium minutum MCA 4210]|uniref:uncharacterized protein n=1 Tax=Cystobasidium minutum MCA 4210 TaxID=1397322 RepID=UPI0034CD177C|eukprot:jgi/Rhomi1/86738/CE86737_4832